MTDQPSGRWQRLRTAWTPDQDAPGDPAALLVPALVAEAPAGTDRLLLDSASQRVHAGVTDDKPFGVPTAGRGSGSPLTEAFSRGLGYLLAVGLAAAVLTVSSQLLLVVVAAFIAIGLEPVIDFLEGKGLRRSVAVALIVLVMLGVLAAFLATAIPPLTRQGSQLISNAPGYLQHLQDQHSRIGRLAESLHLKARLQTLANRGLSLNSFNGLVNLSKTALSYVFQLLIIVVLVIYFLADFPGIKRAVYRLAPLERRPRVGLLGDEIISRTGGFLLGNVLTSVVAAVAQYIVLTVLGVPFALVLAVLVGVLDLVPLVGSTIAGVVVTGVALALVSPTAAVLNIIFTVLYRIFEDYVLSPRILRRTVNVKPVVTIVSVLLGGALLGLEGALISVPIGAAVQLFVTEVVYPRSDNPSVRR